ncbi:MAG: hypothetical protein AMJ90_03295 [candidate division Zixibacteria bacterium SM23_73_2]|nr:MAG: hypothetical protein AMJ90_03295 [candidate division Zixibacteria bacterium SM23_73_2]
MVYDFKANEKLKIYPVRLPCFEGSLDLLLYLIKENQIGIYDIPISLITEQYLAYLELMRILDLEIAGEFLVLASTLMRIKAKMLLPPSEVEEEDPREELVEALLDYQRYRETADFLRDKEAEQSLFYPRSFFSLPENPNPEEEKSSQVSLYNLLEAFKRILDKASEEPVHTVTVLKVTIEQRINHILSCLNNKRKVSFTDLFMDDPKRLVMIVTFIAVLELIRLEKIKVLQRKNFSEIWVYANHSSARRKELKSEGKIEQ